MHASASWCILPACVLMTSCGPNEDRVRAMIADEFARQGTKSFIVQAETIGPYSPAIRTGSFVFVSGQIGLDPATGALAGNDIQAQTRQAMSNLLTILSKAGCDSSDVVQCTVYLTDMKEFPSMNQIYGGYFQEYRYPTRTTVEVRSLPRNAKIEVAAVAYAPQLPQ